MTTPKKTNAGELALERAIVGHLLADEDKLLTFGGVLQPEMFANADHYTCIATALSLVDASSYERLTLQATLSTDKEVSDPDKLLASLDGEAAKLQNFDGGYKVWLDRARKRYHLRKMDALPIEELGYHELGAQASEIIVRTNSLGGQDMAVSAASVANETRQLLAELRASQGKNLFTYGWPKIDNALVTLHGEMITIAAKNGVGKTTLAIQLALRNLGIGPVLYNTLEMPSSQLMIKFLEMGAYSKPSSSRRPWTLDDGEMDVVHKGLEYFSKKPLFFSELKDVHQLRACVRQTKAKTVVVDYFQCLTPDGVTRENRATWLTQQAHALRDLAKEEKCVVIVLSQLNREGADDPDTVHLRDSSGPGDASSVILFLTRPNLSTEGPENLDGYLKCGKARFGAVGVCQKLLFDPRHTVYLPWDEKLRAELSAGLLPAGGGGQKPAFNGRRKPRQLDTSVY